jgi:hypothetical protein
MLHTLVEILVRRQLAGPPVGDPVCLEFRDGFQRSGAHAIPGRD